jgi:hypothetical protein
MRVTLILILACFANIAMGGDSKLSLRGSGMYASGTPASQVYGSVTSTLYSFSPLNTMGFSGALQFRRSGERIEMAYGFEVGSLADKGVEYGSGTVTDPTIHTFIVQQNIAKTYYMPHVMANVKIQAGKAQPYAGIMAGVVVTEAIGKASLDMYPSSPYITEFSSFKPVALSRHTRRHQLARNTAPGAGRRAGCAPHLAGGIRRFFLSTDRPKLKYRLFTFNLTAGINYVF